MHVLKSNFLSSQMDSHNFSPSSLPLHKAKWVQLNGKTLQVLKNSLPLATISLGQAVCSNWNPILDLYVEGQVYDGISQKGKKKNLQTNP